VQNVASQGVSFQKGTTYWKAKTNLLLWAFDGPMFSHRWEPALPILHP